MSSPSPASLISSILFPVAAPAIFAGEQAARAVGGGLNSPRIPETPSPGPAPTPSDPETASKLAAAEASERTRRRRATASLLTSPQGVLGDAPVSVKTLLGS